MDRQICPSGYNLALLGEPRVAKVTFSTDCLSIPDTHVRFLFILYLAVKLMYIKNG